MAFPSRFVVRQRMAGGPGDHGARGIYQRVTATRIFRQIFASPTWTDPTNAEAHAARGFVVSRAFGPTGVAAADFDRALRLAPNADQVVAWSGAVLAREGRREEALAKSRRGAELGPLSRGRHRGVANAALVLGVYDVAVAAARRAVELEPELIEAQALRAFALLLSGRTEDCLKLALAAHIGLRALCLYEAGRVELAQPWHLWHPVAL